jgi:hypothetical protein
VAVHFGEAGHQILALAIDLHRALRHARRLRRADRGDAIAGDDHRLVGDHFAAVHRDDRHVGEGDALRRLRHDARRCQQHDRRDRTDPNGYGHWSSPI